MCVYIKYILCIYPCAQTSPSFSCLCMCTCTYTSKLILIATVYVYMHIHIYAYIDRYCDDILFNLKE